MKTKFPLGFVFVISAYNGGAGASSGTNTKGTWAVVTQFVA